jgi:hypothetical protein
MIKHTLPQDHNHAVKRFPRTLYEAFPQYPDPTFDRTDSIVMGVCGVALVVLITLIGLGY